MNLTLLYLFGLSLCVVLGVEEIAIRHLPLVSVKHATLWMISFACYCTLFGLLVGFMQDKEDAGWPCEGLLAVDAHDIAPAFHAS